MAKTLRWEEFNKNGEEAKNIFSNALKSRVIRLEGEGGPWILGAVSGDMAWSNKKEKWISWKMLLGDRYTIYIPVQQLRMVLDISSIMTSLRGY